MPTPLPKLILFNKPYGVLSQFRRDDGNDYATLSEYFSDKSLRVAGRLDAISEGLLLLTDNGDLNAALTAPPKDLQKRLKRTQEHKNAVQKQGKTYWVQVAGNASEAQFTQLATGVLLKDGMTLPAKVSRLSKTQVQQLWQAPDNIAKRAINTWLSITIFEGKNRQVRRMTAHVGLPCLRLVRVASSGFDLFEHKLAVGDWVELMLTPEQLLRFGLADVTVASRVKTPATSKYPKPASATNLKPLSQCAKSKFKCKS